eukprot:scaffold6792_cov35-Tisochrysis_lutea.AAC.2
MSCDRPPPSVPSRGLSAAKKNSSSRMIPCSAASAERSCSMMASSRETLFVARGVSLIATGAQACQREGWRRARSTRPKVPLPSIASAVYAADATGQPASSLRARRDEASVRTSSHAAGRSIA